MKGGYQIIDLRKIGLELKDTQQTISNAEILNQLRGLRAYIEKGHDYKKPLNNSLKPIMIRYRDQKNNEQREVSSFASIINTNNSLTFTIESKHLQIEVVFEEKTNDDGVKYYDIKTAKYSYSKDEVINGSLSVDGFASFEDGVEFLGVESGTIQDVLGLDEDNLLVKGTISGGTKLYRHELGFNGSVNFIYLISTRSTPYSIDGHFLDDFHDFGAHIYVDDESLDSVVFTMDIDSDLQDSLIVKSLGGSGTIISTTFAQEDYDEDTVTPL